MKLIWKFLLQAVGKRTVSAAGGHQQTLQPIDGNKRKIESLRIENLMKKTEKVSIIDRVQ